MLKKKILILFIAVSTGILAQSNNTFNFSLGAVNGEAGEYVYVPETGEKISYLDWKIKNVPVFILGYTHTFNNIEFQMGLKKNFNSTSSGSMKDYDWYSSYDIDEGATPNDYGKLSNFSDNKNYMDTLLMFDTNIKYWFSHTENLKSGPMLGFKYDYFKFYARGGDQYNYMLDGSITVDLDDGSVKKSVEYSQKIFTPYLGYGVSYKYEKLVLDLEIKGSLYGKAKANDKHLERGPMESDEKYKKVKNLGVKFVATYPLSPSIDINGTLEYSKYFHKKKSSTDFITEDGDKLGGIKDLSGMKNISYVVSLGATYKF